MAQVLLKWLAASCGRLGRRLATAASVRRFAKKGTKRARPVRSSIQRASAVRIVVASWRPRPGSAATRIPCALSRNGVADMALRPPDMGDCSPKNRCRSGPNAGQAYDPRTPCYAGGVFDPLTCDCAGGQGWDSLNANWSMQRSATGSYASADGSWTTPGWYNGYQTWYVSSGGLTNAIYLDSAAFVSTTCCAGGTDSDSSGVWSFKYMVSASSAGLVDPTYRDGCIWPEDCGFCSNSSNRDPGCLTTIVYGRLTATRLNPDETASGGSRRDTYLLFDNIPENSPEWTPLDPEWIIASAPVITYHNVECSCAYQWP